jgi:hypothetical protein
MPLPPLTHHEILRWVEPFTRGGRQVDLQASDRQARQLVFRPVTHDGNPTLTDTLTLDNPEPGRFTLARCVATPAGLQGRWVAEGAEPGELLSRVMAHPPGSLFGQGPGYMLARSLRLQPDALTHLEARVGGLTVKLRMPAVAGYPATVEIPLPEGRTLELPEDLLAVLGWHWDRLSLERGAWRSTLRVRRRAEPERSRLVEARFEAALQHIVRTLAEPPALYHQRLLAARWRVAFRRALPLLVGMGLVAAAVVLPQLDIAQESVVRMLMFNAPPLLVAVGICLQELPRFELPRWPRPPRSATWWRTDTRVNR